MDSTLNVFISAVKMNGYWREDDGKVKIAKVQVSALIQEYNYITNIA